MTRGSRSITLQIVWRHIAALVVVSLAVSVAAHNLLSVSIEELVGNMLRDRATSLARYVTATGGRWAVEVPRDLQDVHLERDAGIFFTLESESGETIFSTFPKNDTPEGTGGGQRTSKLFKEVRESGTYFSLWVPLERDGHRAWLKIARHLNDPDMVVDDIASHFYERIFFVVWPIILILLAVDVLIIDRALAPVRDASNVASSITPNRLDIRLPISTLPGEIQPLAKTINEALERLEYAFEHQRAFTADAAHELRTPLAVLRGHMDLMQRNSEIQALRPSVMTMCRIVDQLLDLADLEAFTIAPDERADLRAVCEDVVGAMAPAALMKEKSIGFTAPDHPVWVSGNAEMIARAVRNLVDNAIRHTPAGSSVEVAVSAGGDVSVADAGPGVALSQREVIFQRFWRGDRRTKEHSGIGLSIVAQVAKLHGAAVSVGDRLGGGALFQINFLAKELNGVPANCA